jgi:hypothetical protein
MHPDAEIINVGIGDISLPLASVVVSAISKAASEMSCNQTIRGYGPSEGYKFLKDKINQDEYEGYGLSSEEIFISDGINSDIANALELFAPGSVVAIPRSDISCLPRLSADRWETQAYHCPALKIIAAFLSSLKTEQISSIYALPATQRAWPWTTPY